MIVEFRDVRERDMDLLIMEEFVSNEGFRNVFIEASNDSKLKLFREAGYVVDKVYHSLATNDGESDMIFVLNSNGERYAIFVEDKVNAVTMENQSSRYIKRANDEEMKNLLGYQDGNYSIFLAAPKEYMREHKNDKNAQYENFVPYESLRECLSKRTDASALFKISMIDGAIAKHKEYVKNINDQVTAFWWNFSVECEKNGLKVLNADQSRATDSLFIRFEIKTVYGGKIQLIYKARQGNIDLQFLGYADKIDEIKNLLGEYLTPDMYITKAGESAVVRIHDESWMLSPLNPPDVYQKIVPNILKNTQELKKLLNGKKSLKKIELLPFKKLCEVKYNSLSIEFPLKNTPEPSAAQMQRLNELLNN